MHQQEYLAKWPAMDGRCRKHSEHRQSKGVCPFCLREKLAHISTSYSETWPITIGSATAYSSRNSSASSDASNSHDVDAAKAQSLKPLTLKKSRSLAFVFPKRKEEEGKKTVNESDRRDKVEIADKNKMRKKKTKKKSGSFWSALIIAGTERRKQMVDGGMLHSKTVMEKHAEKWVNF